MALASCVFAAAMFTSCLTVNAKKIVEAPYVPEPVQGFDVGEIEKSVTVHYSTTDVPEIDGKFAEWDGFSGVHTRRMVYGGMFDPNNADGLFVVRTDGDNLYVYAEISDNYADVNTYELPAAWRGDGVEFFFGTDTSKHTQYKQSDVRVRIISRSKTNPFDVGIGINDNESKSTDIKAAFVYTKNGYKVEAKFPMAILGNDALKPNQKIRADFQINDADNGKERTGLIHWNCPEDNTYANPAGWGNGKVVKF